MRHPIPGPLVCALAAALVLSTPCDARAATGTFTYFTRQGAEAHDITDPVDGRCYAVGEARGIVGNETDRNAYLFDTPDCQGAAAYFPVGFYRLESFHSVLFLH
ncbi:hypothetical protein [Streptomyces sp. NPDC049555]|uniref:hypothetical protein n=1 Tax=unclassified Streptomyces TaxID=2593676 RepID=UPI00343DD95C